MALSERRRNNSWPIVLSLATVLAVVLPARGIWTDHSAAIADNPSICRAGSAVVDTDADGLFEIVFAGKTRASCLLTRFATQPFAVMGVH